MTTKFHQCCNDVITSARGMPKNLGLQYARAYAEAGLAMRRQEEVRPQSLYILNNLQSWRGPAARDCKARLKECAI